MLSSECSQIGTGSSNSPRSASESRFCGCSAQIGEIARACGFNCLMRGTGGLAYLDTEVEQLDMDPTRATRAASGVHLPNQIPNFVIR
jgi:hypothetical protein